MVPGAEEKRRWPGLSPGQPLGTRPGSRDPYPVCLSVPRSFRPPRRHCPSPPGPARCPEPPPPRQTRRDAEEPAVRSRRGRGLPRPAEPGRTHLFAAAVQDPGSGRAAFRSLRAELKRKVPDRVPGKEPHRPRRRLRRRRGLGRLRSGSSGRPSRGGAGRGRGLAGAGAGPETGRAGRGGAGSARTNPPLPRRGQPLQIA